MTLKMKKMQICEKLWSTFLKLQAVKQDNNNNNNNKADLYTAPKSRSH